jgi:hypothetical protein
VLQWPATSIEDYDTMIEIENVLVAALSRNNHVEGHDAGSGTVNIFIETDDPQRTCQQIKSALSSQDMWPEARVAYRSIEGGPYTVLWPKNLHHFRLT